MSPLSRPVEPRNLSLKSWIAGHGQLEIATVSIRAQRPPITRGGMHAWPGASCNRNNIAMPNARPRACNMYISHRLNVANEGAERDIIMSIFEFFLMQMLIAMLQKISSFGNGRISKCIMSRRYLHPCFPWTQMAN